MLPPIHNQWPWRSPLSDGANKEMRKVLRMPCECGSQITPLQPFFRSFDAGENVRNDARQRLRGYGQEAAACCEDGLCPISSGAELRPGQMNVARNPKVGVRRVIVQAPQIQAVQDDNPALKPHRPDPVNGLYHFGLAHLPKYPVCPGVWMDLNCGRTGVASFFPQGLVPDAVAFLVPFDRLRV